MTFKHWACVLGCNVAKLSVAPYNQTNIAIVIAKQNRTIKAKMLLRFIVK